MEAGTNFYKDIHVKDSRREGWVALVAKQGGSEQPAGIRVMLTEFANGR